MVLGMGLFILGINLKMILSLGSCPVLRQTPKAFPVWTSGSNSVSTSRSHSMPGLWTMFYASFLIMFYASFHSDYGPAVFLSTHCQVYPGCFVGLQRSPWPSGGPPIGPPHMLVEELILFCFQEHLHPQQRMSAFAAYPKVRRGSPGLPFSFSLLHKRGTLVLCLGDTHCGTHPSVLFGMCGTLSDARQIDLLLNWVLLCCLGSPGGTYILPLSSLVKPHARTSHVR